MKLISLSSKTAIIAIIMCNACNQGHYAQTGLPLHINIQDSLFKDNVKNILLGSFSNSFNNIEIQPLAWAKIINEERSKTFLRVLFWIKATQNKDFKYILITLEREDIEAENKSNHWYLVSEMTHAIDKQPMARIYSHKLSNQDIKNYPIYETGIWGKFGLDHHIFTMDQKMILDSGAYVDNWQRVIGEPPFRFLRH